MIEIIAMFGRCGSECVFSSEIPITKLLKIVCRHNYDPAAGLNIKEQTGTNRAWDEQRSYHIAEGMEKALKSGQPIELGCVILTDEGKSEEDFATKVIKRIYDGPNGRVMEIAIAENKLALNDRQHTTGALEIAAAKPDKFPNLNKYVQDNTVSIKVIQCPKEKARKRFSALNYRAKPLNATEKHLFQTLDALDAEAHGNLEVYEFDMPVIVGFKCWFDMAKDKSSIWYERALVDSKPTSETRKGVKTPTPITALVEQTSVLYEMCHRYDNTFIGMSISEKSDYLRNILHRYWQYLAEKLPNAAGDDWHKHLLQKRGAKLLLKVLTSLIRMWADRKGTQSDTLLYKYSFMEFCTEGLYLFLDKSGDESPYHSSEYWDKDGVRFAQDEDDKALAYMWDKLNVFGYRNWKAYLESARTSAHNSKVQRAKFEKNKIYIKEKEAEKKGEEPFMEEKVIERAGMHM